MFIDRPHYRRAIERGFRVHPAVAITGPRQVGKTTLARRFAKDVPPSNSFDLERAADVRRLENPELVLESLRGLVVIDEIQRKPALYETIRFLVDRPSNDLEFLLLGSASPALVKGASETLAGRVSLIDLSGFNLEEVGDNNWRLLWERGGFPRSYLAPDSAASLEWRRSFVRTFLERDIPQLGINLPAERLRQFWTMIAHYHGQEWNAAEFARSLGTSEPTARKYLDILVGSHMVRILPSWYENIKKRQRKAPKIYVRDSGVLHSLLGIEEPYQLFGHPKVGASWEGFAFEQVIALSGIDVRDAYFWGSHGGAELDLMVLIKGKRYGFEFKLSDAPRSTKSMRTALSDLNLEQLWIVYTGTTQYRLDDRITALPITMLVDVVTSLRQ